MKRVILISVFCTLLIYQFCYSGNSQLYSQPNGLWIELKTESASDSVSKIFVSFNEIKDFPFDSVLTEARNNKEELIWCGANLCNLLEKFTDISCKRIKKLVISAPDGYTSVISGELLSSLPTAICAYRTTSSKDWNENYGYMRMIFPDLRSMYWVNSPNKMVITIGENQTPLHQYQIFFLDNPRLSKLIKKDLQGNPYLVIDDLLVELKLPQNNFHVLTSDGLFREYPKNDINRYFVLQKQELGTWEINGINVPKGLKTRQIFFLSSGNKGIFLKALNSEEQKKWECFFLQPLIRDNFSLVDLRIEMVSNDAKKSISNLASKLSNKYFSLYDFLKAEQNNHPEINYFFIRW